VFSPSGGKCYVPGATTISNPSFRRAEIGGLIRYDYSDPHNKHVAVLTRDSDFNIDEADPNNPVLRLTATAFANFNDYAPAVVYKLEQRDASLAYNAATNPYTKLVRNGETLLGGGKVGGKDVYPQGVKVTAFGVRFHFTRAGGHYEAPYPADMPSLTDDATLDYIEVRLRYEMIGTVSSIPLEKKMLVSPRNLASSSVDLGTGGTTGGAGSEL